MKNLLLGVLLIFLSLNGNAQKIRFSDRSNQWKVVDGIIGPPSEEYYYMLHYSGMAMSGTFIYQVLTGGTLGSTAYIWEDTLGHRVDVKINDTVSEILMDYNLHVGDTAVHWSDNGTGYFDTFMHVVTQIDSVLVDGIVYPVWHYKGVYPPVSSSKRAADYNIIEGIGSTGGPLFPLYPVQPENYWVLYCFSNNSTSPHVSPPVAPYSFDNNRSCHLSVNILNLQSERVYLFPNPIGVSSKIIFANQISNGSLIIYNSYGQIILNATIRNLKEYRVGDKISQPGLYFYRVQDNNNVQVFSGKFIYQ